MKNKLGIIVVVIVLLNFTGAYFKMQRHSKASENFECKDLAVVDKKCQEVNASVSTRPQVDNEMNDLAKSYWAKYLCQKHDSYYIHIVDTGFLYELKEVRFNGVSFEQTPADKLNNIEKTGVLSVDALAHRPFYDSKRKWADWRNYGSGINIKVYTKKINGEWQAENQEEYIRPDCSNLP